jgi:hypothetical protein
MDDSTFVQDRLRATGLATCITLIGLLNIATRVVKLVTEIAKVIFYSLASLPEFDSS